jgi:hypothetical protein
MRHAALLGLVLSASACSDNKVESGGAGEIQVTISGETLAREGFAFPEAPGQEATFIDGWEVKFEHVYVSVGGVTVAEDPNKSSADQAAIGPTVAKLDGQFLVDLHNAGAVPGKGEGDTAVLLGKIANQNLAGNKAFDAAKTYAFNYETLPALPTATRVGLASADDANVSEMAQKGYSVFYVGSASFKGTDCSPASAPVLDALPKTVSFRFGFKTKAKHINCENPDLGAGETAQRGLALKQNVATVAQITYHVDHPFWNAIEEDAPLRFDHLAFYAKAKSKGTSAAPLTLEDLVGASFAPVAAGTEQLPERTCKPAPAPAAAGTLSLDPKGRSAADLAAFMTILQAPQAHLNADGLCALGQ